MRRVAWLIALLASFEAMAGTDRTAGDGLAFTAAVPGNIFTNMTGSVVLKIGTSAEVLGGTVAVSDETGACRMQQVVGAGVREVPVELPAKGYYRLQAEVRLAGGQVLTNVTTAAVIGSPPDEEQRLNSRFGLWSVHGDRALTLAAGAGWDRVMSSLKDYPQSVITNTPDPSILGPAIAPPPFRMIGVVSFGLPLWLMDLPEDYRQKGFSHPFRPPRDWGQLRALVESFARKPRWKWFPPYFEVYNEPDAHWQGSMAELARFHTEVARAVKVARPGTKVLGPCMYSIRMPYFRQLVGQGLLDELDGVVMHPYVNGTPPEGSFIQRVIDLKQYLASIGKADLPIFFTEFGWTTGAGSWMSPVDELTQARYVSRSLTLLAAERIDCIMYFCLLFKTSNAGEAGFSVLRQDNTPKPSYAAYANVVRWLTGVGADAQWLRLSPNVNLVLFPGKSTTVAVAWDTDGTAELALPESCGRAEDMMGRALSLQREGRLPLTPSPCFIEINDPAFSQIHGVSTVQVTRGTSHTLPDGWGQAVIPMPLQSNRETLSSGKISVHVPADTPPGQYLVLGKVDGHWQALPLEVQSQLSILSSEVKWPLTDPVAHLEVKALCRSGLHPDVPLRLNLELNGAVGTFDAQVPKNGQLLFDIPLKKLVLGKRYKGALVVMGGQPEDPERDQVPVDLTLLTCEEKTSTWEKLPWQDFSGWSPFIGSEQASLDAQDCSARVQIGYDAIGLHLRVRVRDDHFEQNMAPSMMWRQDSLQFAFDIDADKPWEANIGGLGGHRIFHYGVGRKGDQEMTWRWDSYDLALPSNVPEPRIRANVTREGDITEYQVTFPWAVLGLEGKPAAGGVLGFAMAVNDDDATPMGRHGLRLFGGIVENQDPQHFGRLWLR